MAYRKLALDQGTPEWIEARYDYVTASQVAAILGLSPYQTRLQLFEEKLLREQPPVNPGKEILFARGHNAEKAARTYFEKSTGLAFDPCVIASIEHPCLLASLDGFNEKVSTIFEAKFVGAEALHGIKNGEVPAHHLAQVQAALLVSGAKNCKYFATDPSGDSAIFEILPDATYQEVIAEEAKKFMEENVKKGVPPELSERDVFTPESDPRFAELSGMKEQLDFMQVKFDALKASIVDSYKDHARVKYQNISITRTIRKGNIDYKKVPVLRGIDLERYRGRPSEVVTVKIDLKSKIERVA